VTWWLWAIAGAGAFVVLSVVASLGIAALLGQIGRDVSDLLESEAWTRAPLGRDEGEVEAKEPKEATEAEAKRPFPRGRVAGNR
jgi:hypothetical protein